VFSQLIASGVIDTKNNSPLLNTVLDMLGVLVHGIVPAEGPIENSRIYMTLVRKIRKDIGERRSEALDEVKRFLPLQKPSFDIYVVEPFARKVEFLFEINGGIKLLFFVGKN
jgi:mediator of RNA polymerase II transcription subunit 12